MLMTDQTVKRSLGCSDAECVLVTQHIQSLQNCGEGFSKLKMCFGGIVFFPFSCPM